MDLANNDPFDWDIPPGYFKKGRRGGLDDRGPLERHHIDEAIAEAVGTKGNPKYQSRDGRDFSFWEHLRFGPLVADPS
jgi:hypothetical protein